MAPSTTRRRFLQHSAGLAAALPGLASGLRAFGGPPTAEGRVLVVLEQAGGNDGLSMVVPYVDDHYHRARPTLRIPANQALALDDHVALHPAMTGSKELFERGHLAVVQGVGYPRPDRSHFQSRDIWHAGTRDVPALPTGWLGRLGDRWSERSAGDAMVFGLGKIDRVLALRGAAGAAPVLNDLEGFRLEVGDGGDAQERRRRVQGLARQLAPQSDNLRFLQDVADRTYSQVERLQQIAASSPPRAEYPPTELARKLGLAAQLIVGGLPCRVLYLTHGGYDTHALQAETHRLLLQELDQALSAFFQDLAGQGADRRVCLFTFSEFGRRVQENGSRGTDHGAAGPCLLYSPAVRGGVHGPPPALDRLVEGDVPHTVDFRRVYATLLHEWLGQPTRGVLEGEWRGLGLFARAV